MTTPRYVIDLAALRRNLEILSKVKQDAECKIVLALKGYALWKSFPLIRDYLDGCCASGLWEAKLSQQEFGSHTLTYSPAYKEPELLELLEISNHLDFNSPSQWLRFRDLALKHPRYHSGKLKLGLRINPEHSTGSTPIYDPCAAGSRLGTTTEQLDGVDLTGITGLHFHTLCEQNSHDLKSTLEAIHQKFGHILSRPEITWLNMGGGHWITKPDYDCDLLVKLIRETKQRYQLEDVWLEPGEAIAIHTGVLEASVLDIVTNAGQHIAILDVSATCHMPDVLEMPYRPDVIGPNGLAATASGQHLYRLGGPSCLAGDVIGDYAFSNPLKVGDKLTFDDMAHYTMVKTTTFNGVPHPAIALKHEDGSIECLREFGYHDFRDRLC
ncbi:carboxynorspermidine decarboxylase [Rubritalea marina]|uniref:carboxynorspermidine decarboxylase n=1 Tax=Rubritalea marina TaxID=361055 RepID=UPI0003649F7E|nr:carboxynorspermidine decarboxylase [Rubritalea marina]